MNRDLAARITAAQLGAALQEQAVPRPVTASLYAMWETVAKKIPLVHKINTKA